MIHAYHATFGMYGSWLPNDPRGSASRYVGSRALYNLGGKTFQTDRVKMHRITNEDQMKIEALRRTLKRSFVVFSERQIAAMGDAVEDFVTQQRLEVWACAILPCHVHVVFARCGRQSEQIVGDLKDHVDMDFAERGLLPIGCDTHKSMFAAKQWIVFLDSESAIDAAIAYVVDKPGQSGKSGQSWPFVVPFRGLEGGLVSYND